MDIYRPRMVAQLDVPYMGTAEERAKQQGTHELTQIVLPLREITVENNDHNHADSCSVTVDWRDTTLDTRMLDGAVITVWCGNADENGFWSPNDDDVVFIGHTRNPERVLEEGEDGSLRIECLDYTGLYLDAQPFPNAGIPDYSQTLEEAWRRICSMVKGAGPLADALVAVGTDVELTTRLGKAVAPRFARLSKVPTHPKTDAWAVWQQCVGMLGLISFIDKDTCVVTQATNYYTERDPPIFTWGKDVKRLSESRADVDIKGGVGLVSFDALTGKTLEAFFPPIGDTRVQRKISGAKRKKALPKALSSEEFKRHIFTMWGVTDPEQLELIAERVWQQITRQELSGKVETPHMFLPTPLGRQFNLLKLRSGDDIRVEFADGEKQYLAELPSRGARVQYLVERGYARDVALLLAKNVEAFAALGTTFYVDSVRKKFSLDASSGDFSVEVSFINKIEVSKGAIR